MLRNRGSATLSAVAVGIGLLIAIGLLGAVLSYKQVPEGHAGVTTEWGAVTNDSLDPGAHWKVPIMQGVQDVETRPRTYTMAQAQGEGKKANRSDAVAVQTVNGTTVDVDVTIRYRVDRTNVAEFVREWNNVQQMEQRLIRPTVRSELRDEAAQIQTSHIYTSHGREALAAAAREALNAEFADEPITLEAVQIRNVDLPRRIDNVLDEKEEAKQRVQVEQEQVQQAKQRAEQRRIEARGEADVIRTRGQALRNNTIVLEARLIEAYENNTVFVTGEGGQEMIIDASGGQNGR